MNTEIDLVQEIVVLKKHWFSIDLLLECGFYAITLGALPIVAASSQVHVGAK